MKGKNNGRLDRSRRGPHGLLYLVSLMLVTFAGSAQAYTNINEGTFATFDEAKNACVADVNAFNDAHSPQTAGAGDPAGVYDNNCLNSETSSTPGPSWIEEIRTTESWQTYQYEAGDTHSYYYTECPEGETRDATGQCVAPECTEGETITGTFDGTGLSVCDGSCNYTTTHGYNGDTNSGSMTWDSNGYGSSNLPQRHGVWVNDGTSCSSGTPVADSITTDQGTTLAFEQDQPNCGTVNGERFCAPSLPEGGKCVLVGSNGYICGNAGDQPVVPPHDPSTTTVTENDAVTSGGANGEGTSITISAGTIDNTTPSDGLDEGTTTPEAGSDEAKEDPTFCENNPEMCDLDDGLGEDPTVPEETFDLSSMTSNYSSGIADTAECPATETIAVLGTSFDFPWTSFCNFADLIRPFVIAAGFLAAFLFAVRALA